MGIRVIKSSSTYLGLTIYSTYIETIIGAPGIKDLKIDPVKP